MCKYCNLLTFPILDSTTIVHAFAVFALFGLIWTIQLVHYPMFKYVEAPHWPRAHTAHSRNMTFLVFPLMLIELLTCLQLVIENGDLINIVSLSCCLLTWLFTLVIFLPLHQRVAVRPIPNLLALLTRLNWLRTIVWTISAANVFTQLLGEK